ncbi:hypothetical protein K1719_018470 [Acacia pycnantha]|nr:hypothetical protein K1719_018470 [Acacia pycnantha]
MSSNDSVRDEDIIFQAAKDGMWGNIIKMYEEKKELRTVKEPSTGDTVLHMAVSSGRLYRVEYIVDLVCRRKSNEQAANENGNEKNLVFGAKNKKGNTPLHLAASASNGSFEMCKKVGGADRSIITTGNNDGETPLFLAALHGNKEAFLWLYYNSPQDSSSDYKRDDNDTILHCAIAGGHIDVAIEIVHLYKYHIKGMMMMRNKNGLSPLHILAATPSAFESTDLSSRFFVVRLLYRFFRVKMKKQATTMEELERPEWKKYENGYIIYELVLHALSTIFCGFDIAHHPESLPSYIRPIRVLILFLRMVWAWVLMVLRIIPKIFISAEAGYIIVDPPLMIAAKNGVIEMVEKILQRIPSGIHVLDDEGKNIVLLAAEKRQTRLYQFLCRDRDENAAFKQVDKDDNTALHLAAKPGINLYGQTTTMIEEFKWFQFVKSSVPSELWERYNKKGKTAEEIFRDSYKKHMRSDRKWLDQTSQTCTVASTIVAGMAFSNFAGENFKRKNDASLVALSLSLTSTISFLAILAFRSQSLVFWKYVPIMLQIAILTMFGSIVALWISLIHGQSITTCAILGSPIAILTIVSLPIFIGPMAMSMFNPVPPPNRNTTSAIQYRRPQKKKNAVDKDQKTTPNPTNTATDPKQDTARSPDDTFKQQKDEGGSAS